MKRITFLAVFFSILFMATNSWCQQDTCVVLIGSPLTSDSYKTVKKILKESLNCYVKEISLEKDEIATADLSNVKFLYWAGGTYYDFKPLKAAADNIRHAVANGMGYFGTCGGSLIAVETTPSSRMNQLRLFPGFQPFGSGTGMRDYEMNLTHPIIVNSSLKDYFSEFERIHYNGGGSDFVPSVQGLVNWVVAKDIIRDTPALTSTLYGKGRVFLTVSHPERSYIPETWKFVQIVAEWCMGRSDPKNNQAPLIQTNIPNSGDVMQNLLFSAAGSDDPEHYPIGFIWDFGDGSELAFRPEEKHIYTKSGIFKLKLTVTDGKDETKLSKDIYIGVTPNEITAKSNGSFKLYPNPASDEVILDLEQNLNGFYTLDIISLKGEIIKSIYIGNIANYTMDVSSLTSGVYFVRLKSDKLTMIEKMILKL